MAEANPVSTRNALIGIIHVRNNVTLTRLRRHGSGSDFHVAASIVVPELVLRDACMRENYRCSAACSIDDALYCRF